MPILAGILFLSLGLLMLLKPESVFSLTESWKQDASAEPSGLYLISTRFGGVILLGVGVLCFAAQFLQ